MKTILLETINDQKNILRAIYTFAENNNKLVLCLSGFESASSTGKKFKILADNLVNQGMDTVRLDFQGHGLSDGEFRQTTVQSRLIDAKKIIEEVIKQKNYQELIIIAHSLGGCVANELLEEINLKIPITKMVLFAPALNLKELLRYLFVKKQMRKINPTTEITWENFKVYLKEEEFLNDCQQKDKMTKMNYIDFAFFLENKNKDYFNNLQTRAENILLIQGDKDKTVPGKSLPDIFPNKIIVLGGDHNLERPDMMNQWLEKTLNFITN